MRPGVLVHRLAKSRPCGSDVSALGMPFLTTALFSLFSIWAALALHEENFWVSGSRRFDSHLSYPPDFIVTIALIMDLGIYCMMNVLSCSALWTLAASASCVTCFVCARASIDTSASPSSVFLSMSSWQRRVARQAGNIALFAQAARDG